MTWLAIDVRLKFLFVKRFAIQVAWMLTDVWFKWFWLPVLVVTEHGQEKHVIYRVIYRNLCVIDLDVRWFGIQAIWLSFDWFEVQMIWLSTEMRFTGFLMSIDRLPSKCKLSRWKTKLFCGTSFKNEALKIKNEAFLRDFLQKWHVDQTLDLRIPIRFSDFQVNASKVLRLPRKSWAEAYELL